MKKVYVVLVKSKWDELTGLERVDKIFDRKEKAQEYVEKMEQLLGEENNYFIVPRVLD